MTVEHDIRVSDAYLVKEGRFWESVTRSRWELMAENDNLHRDMDTAREIAGRSGAAVPPTWTVTVDEIAF